MRKDETHNRRALYLLEYVRDGVIIRQERAFADWLKKPNGRKSTALRIARNAAKILPVAGESWGKRIGWLIRVKHRESGLYVAAFERVNGRRGTFVRSL